MSREQKHEIEIDAPVEAVWQAISDGEELTRWYAENATVVPGEGGTVAFDWGDGGEGRSRIDVWEPGRRLRLVSEPSPESGFGLDEPLVEEWTIEARGGRTVLTLVFSGLPEGGDWDLFYDSTEHGWAMFLHRLRFYVERHLGSPRRSLVASRPITGPVAEVWAGLALPGETVFALPERTLLAVPERFGGALLAVTLEGEFLWANLSSFGARPDEAEWLAWLDALPATGPAKE